jgi:transposase-like protein
MKLVKHNPKINKSVWQCVKCESYRFGKGTVKYRCPLCGYEDPHLDKTTLKYVWHRRPIGYTRTILDEGGQIKQAKRAVYQARAKYGMDISMRMTFAGLTVTVLSLPTATPEGIDV